MKKIPRFWWDFTQGTDAIIVESDTSKYPVLARFPIVGKDATAQIEQAEKMISDLQSGRLTLKQATTGGKQCRLS